MIVLFGLVAVVFLYIGMIGMDKSNKKKFHNIYGKMVGIKFTYEIDAENIIITDEENDSDTFSWNEVVNGIRILIIYICLLGMITAWL